MSLKPIRKTLWAAVVLLLLALGIGYVIELRYSGEQTQKLDVRFSLIDQNGNSKTEEDFSKDHMLVYFGFSHCPDFCPETLQKMAVVLKTLGSKADHIRPLFVTLDPSRDTPEVLKEYLAMFGQNIQGLTGDEKYIQTLVDAFKVYFAKKDDGKGTDYTLDHSTMMFWVTPGWNVRKIFHHEATPEEICKDLGEGIKK